MTQIKAIIWTLVGIMGVVTSHAQSAHSLLRKGDKAYEREDYLSAEEHYRKSTSNKPSQKGSFNLGNSVYQQERYEEAIQHYESTIAAAKTDIERANARFNLGTAQLKAGELEKAVESYKEAYKLNPSDKDILKNLYISKLLIEQQQKQEQENQQQQEQDQKQEQQEQDNQEGEQQEQGEDSSAGNSAESQDAPVNGESDAGEPQNLSKEDAMKLLDVIENEEKSVQEKLRKGKGGKKKPKKDW